PSPLPGGQPGRDGLTSARGKGHYEPPRATGRSADKASSTRLAPTPEAIRQLILHVLAQHPAGLTPGEVASQLGLTTSLTATLRAMHREGLIRRVSAGVYAGAAKP